MYGHACNLMTLPLARITKLSPLDQHRAVTRPVPGRPGVRVDQQGREFYSADWIGKP